MMEAQDPQIDENEDGSATVEMPDTDLDMEEMPDGSAVVNIPDDGPEENPDFYANMAEDHDQYKLSQLSMRYIDLLTKDKDAREQRDKQYEEGIRRTARFLRENPFLLQERR